MQATALDLKEPITQRHVRYADAWRNSLQLSSAPLGWQDVCLQRRIIPPFDWPEAVFPYYSLSVSLTPTPITTTIWHRGGWQDFAINPNSVFVLSANHPTHSVWNESFDHAVVSLTPELMQRVSGRECPELRYSPYHPQDERIQHIVMAMLAEVKAGGSGGRLYGEGLATALAAHLMANWAVSPVIFPSNRRGLSQADLKRVTEYLRDNLTKDVSLETLAGLVAISPFHFCRLFKQSTGLSPHQFVIQERVERARHLLLAGDLTSSQAAVEVGFAHQSHLARHMKRLLSVTPAQLQRKNAREKSVVPVVAR